MPTIGAEAALPVETARLRLRPLAASDAPTIERLAGDWEIARYTAHIPHPYPPGSAAPWIEETWGEPRSGKKVVAPIEPRSGRPLGGCHRLHMTHGTRI